MQMAYARDLQNLWKRRVVLISLLIQNPLKKVSVRMTVKDIKDNNDNDTITTTTTTITPI